MNTTERLEIAGDWLQRLEDPQIPESHLREWLEWFEASEDNRQAFTEMQLLYARFQNMSPELRARLKQLTRRNKRSRVTVWALAASVVVAVGAGFLWREIGSSAMLGRDGVVYSASKDRHRSVRLDDGSAIALAADSTVAVRYTSADRKIELRRGQSYFEVGKDTRRPFIVTAGEVQVVALGTAFNVIRENERVVVTVTDGSVEVARGLDSQTAPRRRLAAGQRVVLPLSPAPAALPDSTSAERFEWHNGQAAFDNVPLSHVIAVVNRYATTRVSIDDPRVADMRYSGSIMREHLGEWIDSLPRLYPVRCVSLDDGSVALVSGK